MRASRRLAGKAHGGQYASGKMTYNGDRFEGTVKTVMLDPDGNMTMTTAVRGKCVSACQ